MFFPHFENVQFILEMRMIVQRFMLEIAWFMVFHNLYGEFHFPVWIRKNYSRRRIDSFIALIIRKFERIIASLIGYNIIRIFSLFSLIQLLRNDK